MYCVQELYNAFLLKVDLKVLQKVLQSPRTTTGLVLVQGVGTPVYWDNHIVLDWSASLSDLNKTENLASTVKRKMRDTRTNHEGYSSLWAESIYMYKLLSRLTCLYYSLHWSDSTRCKLHPSKSQAKTQITTCTINLYHISFTFCI